MSNLASDDMETNSEFNYYHPGVVLAAGIGVIRHDIGINALSD